MKEIRHLKTIKNKRNLNTKWFLLRNDQNADTTLLHSHDDMAHQYSRVGFNSSVEVNEVNLSLSFGGVGSVYAQFGKRTLMITSLD